MRQWEPIERGLSRLLRTSDTLREAVAVATSGAIADPDLIGVEYERLRTLALAGSATALAFTGATRLDHLHAGAIAGSGAAPIGS